MVNQPSGISSFRNVEQAGAENQPQRQPQTSQALPQPIARRQPPPPIPTDRSSNSSNRIQNESYKYPNQQQQQQQYNEEEPAALIRQYSNQRIPQQPPSQPQSQQGSYRQGLPTSSYMNTYVPNEASKSGSISSTPDVNKVKKQIIVNEQVNHKDVRLSSFFPFAFLKWCLV
jgi:hypothetical protein